MAKSFSNRCHDRRGRAVSLQPSPTEIVRTCITGESRECLGQDYPAYYSKYAFKFVSNVISAKTKYDLFLNEIALVVGPNVGCRNTVHELPVRLTSLIYTDP